MNVADVMTPRSELVTASLPGSREDVLTHLQERKFSSVPVVKETADGEVFRGLVSRERLIEDPNEDQLALLLEEGVTTTRETPIDELARLMVTADARRVPVVDGDLEGIVTITDVVHAIATGDVDGETPVGELATSRVNTVYRETPLHVVERELSFAEEAYGVVLDDDGEMCGIVTDADIIDVAEVVEGEERTGDSVAGQDSEWAWEGIKGVGNLYLPTRNVEIPTDPVASYMTADVVTVSGRRTARETAHLLISNDVEQIPLVSGDSLGGIVKDMHLLVGLYE